MTTQQILLRNSAVIMSTPVVTEISTVSSGSVTTPYGATQVVIEVWGAGNSGGKGGSGVNGGGGGGGGGGGYSKSVYTTRYGLTFNYNLSASSSKVSSGTRTMTATMTANRGSVGTNGTISADGTGGNGGTATGGNIENSTGTKGNDGFDGAGGYGGGPAVPISTYATGGKGGNKPALAGSAGTGGFIRFTFTGYNPAPPFDPITRTYTSGSGTETVPDGATSVTIEVVGGGQGGYVGDDLTGGSGGNSGGYSKSTYSCTAGKTLNYSVGAAGTGGRPGGGSGGDSTVTSGTMSITSMTGGGATSSVGSASGGNVTNTSGDTGAAGDYIDGGLGANSAWPSDTYGAGGNGGGPKDIKPYGFPGDAGIAGAVRFTYT